VERAVEGDRDAFETLIRKYSRLVYAQVWGMVRDSADAEDLVQAAFLKAWRGLDSLRDAGAFAGWLLAISGNLARDHGKKKRPQPIPEEADQLPDAGGPDPGAGLETGEVRERVHAALASLPERQRIAVTLRYLEGMNLKAIQETMGLTNGALRGVLGRGLSVLRRTLKPLKTQP